MLTQEDFDRMDWLSYGYACKLQGEAMAEARAEARGKIIGTVNTLRKIGYTDSEIIDWLVSNEDFSPEEAKEYLDERTGNVQLLE